MKRRTVWLGGAAAAATVAGIGAANWRGRDEASPWSLRFDRPEGGDLALAGLRGKPLLLNFWATWCPPCVAELPLLDGFSRTRAGWQVVGLAVDQLDPVQRFLALHPVSYPVGMAGLDGVALARRLGDASGGLPFSLVYSSVGRPQGQQLGALTSEVLQHWADAVT